MQVESYERTIRKTCRKCYTIRDFRRDYCCAKGKDECFADLGLVRKGVMQDENTAERLYVRKKVDEGRNILDKKFFRGRLWNECLVFDYRPPGCRSHFCDRWDRYIKEKPLDMVHANLRVISTGKLKEELKREFAYGIRLAYPGGWIIYTSRPLDMKKAVSSVLKEMGVQHFFTRAEFMEPEKNEKTGVEVIVDEDKVLEEPGLFGTLINNNMFMLVRMKMNMGSTGFTHANIMITAADPEKVALESSASLKSFHALKAFWIE
jgi:hypothetical protein